jgi:outer membrane protein OmpA-like peptidoglycan-associated protein
MAPILAPFQQTTIIVTGYTDNTPNDTPQGRAQNRRVELTLAGPGT